MRLRISSCFVAAIAVLTTGTAIAQTDSALPGRAGARIERTIAGSGKDSLRITLPAASFVRIEVMQQGVDLIVSLLDAQGQTVMEADSTNQGFGPETLVAISESAGDYRLAIGNGDPSAGHYSARVVELRQPAPGDRELIAAHRGYQQSIQLLGKRTPAARQEAIEKLAASRDYFRAGGEHYMLGLALYTMGAGLGDQGRFRETLVPYAEAAAEFRAVNDRLMEARALNNRAGALDVLGEPEQALENYRAALPAYVSGGDLVAQANTLNNIASIELGRSEWQSALKDLQQALELSKEGGDKRVEAIVLSNTGLTYQRLGDLDRALSLLGEALPLRRVSRDQRGEAVTLQELSSIELQQHRPEKALVYLDQAITVARAVNDRRIQANTLRFQGEANFDLGRLEAAKSSLVEGLSMARALQERSLGGQTLEMLARIELKAGNASEAASRSQEAVREFRAIGDRRWTSLALETEARAASAAGNTAEARRLIEESLAVNETVRQGTDSQQLRASFLATREDAHSFYVDLLMRSGEESAALEANERARARSLVEMLGEAGAGLRAGNDAALVARGLGLAELLNAKGARLLPIQGSSNPRAAELTTEIRKLEAEYDDAQAAIRRGNSQYAEAMQPRLLTVKQIESELLDADTLLLEYSLGEERSYLWVVDRSGLKCFALGQRARIEEQVRKTLALVTTRNEAAAHAALRELSGMVLGRAGPLLGGKRLVIVPDGALQRLPFAMVPLADGEPLLVRHEIVMAPSASALAAVRRQVAGRKAATKMVAVFADPVFGREDARAGGPGPSAGAAGEARILEHTLGAGPADAERLKISRLPFTAQEADRILGVAQGAANLRAVGFEATRETAVSGQLSDYRYLHFATHGYLDTERPSLSALVLSQIDRRGVPEDGFLRVNDIYNARLSADLAVLSACQTGLGKEVRGEGLMGLTRAFLYAGVPRVIVSLWNVNDRATAELMASLYKGLLKDGKRPATALREAQLTLRKNKRWESPFYWAAFVQHGEWE